jgi:hypothetical protein
VATPGVATAPGTVAPETVAAWAGAAAALSAAWVDVVTPGMAAWASAVAPGIVAWPRGEAVEIVILKTFFSEGGPVLKITNIDSCQPLKGRQGSSCPLKRWLGLTTYSTSGRDFF